MSGRAYFHVSEHSGISEQRKLEAELKEVKDDWVDNEKTLDRAGDLFLNVLVYKGHKIQIEPGAICSHSKEL